MQEIIPPTTCPSCESELTWRKDILYCINDTCESKSQKAIEHWAKSLKIKGLGPSTISKLEIESIIDLYELTEDYISVSLGSEKLASKLFLEIEKSKSATLNRVLPAFGIPLIGNSATSKVCSVISHIDELSEEATVKAKLGPKATDNLLTWYYETYQTKIKPSLPFDLKTEQEQSTSMETIGVVCISGKLKSVKTKAEAKKLLVSKGYEVKDSLTKAVTILINESGIESAKTTKARESGVLVITDLNQLLGA